jgi:hypothetical protein
MPKTTKNVMTEGREAYLADILISKNPYQYGSAESSEWQRGWMKQRDINNDARKTGKPVPKTVGTGGRPKGYSPGEKELRCGTCRFWVSPFAGRAVCIGVGPSVLQPGSNVAVARHAAGAQADLILVEGRVVGMAVWPSTKEDDGCRFHVLVTRKNAQKLADSDNSQE